MPTEEEIAKLFPMECPREGQIPAVKFILDSFDAGKKIVVLEAPTGAGKSAIAIAASLFYKDSYYITANKSLQDQLCRDFGEQGKHTHLLIDLKGRNAYECTHQPDPLVNTAASIRKWNMTAPHSCADGHCKLKDKSFYLTCIGNKSCPYYEQVQKALASPMCLMNFSSFLYQTAFTKRFDRRRFMIIDEGHNAESQLMNFVSLSVSDVDFGFPLPEYSTPEQYATWFDDNKIVDILTKKLSEAKIEEDARKIEELESQIGRMGGFIKEMATEGHGHWVSEFTTTRTSRRVTFKPVFVDKYARHLLFSYADNILIMSATILDVNIVSRSLGIDKSEVAAMRMASKFPVEKRPIYYKPAAKVTGGKGGIDRWGHQLTAAVNDIVHQHKGVKGIIHTHNFYIAEMLINDCDDDVKKRLLYQKEFRTKTEMLEYHTKTQDTILIAPAMHEGIDLYDDLCYDQHTEVLTECGWLLFSDLIDGIRVAAYNPVSSTVDFEFPSRITHTTADRWVEYDTMTNNLMVTASHRMLWRNSMTGRTSERIADNPPGNRHYQFVCGGLYNSRGTSTTDIDLKLIAAYQADGCWVSDCASEVRFGLRRDRKVRRLLNILNEGKYEHRMSRTKRGDAIILVPKRYFVPLRSFGDWDNDKIWKLDGLLNLDARQRKVLLSELPHWDGVEKSLAKDAKVYTSSEIRNLDTIMAVAALTGYRSDYNSHRVSYRESPYALFVPGEYNYITHNMVMDAYCCTVSTGWLVVRRKGKATVSGNSRFQIICKVPFPNQFEDKQLAARMEVDPQFYEWLTALKLVQSAGRSVRSNTDWADTYIIDESFGWWYRKNGRLLPQWFKESIIQDP